MANTKNSTNNTLNHISQIQLKIQYSPNTISFGHYTIQIPISETTHISDQPFLETQSLPRHIYSQSQNRGHTNGKTITQQLVKLISIQVCLN
jgi:hypothetical protein